MHQRKHKRVVKTYTEDGVFGPTHRKPEDGNVVSTKDIGGVGPGQGSSRNMEKRKMRRKEAMGRMVGCLLHQATITAR